MAWAAVSNEMFFTRIPLFLLFFLVTPWNGVAQDDYAPSYELMSSQDGQLRWPPHSNPTHLLITPRNDQSLDQQIADQVDCYTDVCQELEWDPYQAYDALVADGFAVALNRREMERGLIFLAAYGAEVGAVAGELAKPHHHREDAAHIGAGIAVAAELIRSQYLLHTESPEAQRVVRRYERSLRKWVRKYSACMSREGYRVD